MKDQQTPKQTQSKDEKFNLGQKEAEQEKKGASQMKDMSKEGAREKGS